MPVSLRVGPRGIEAADPQTAVLSFVMPRQADVERNLIETFCCHVHFIASPQAGGDWISRHSGVLTLSLGDAWQIGIRKNAAQYAAGL